MCVCLLHFYFPSALPVLHETNIDTCKPIRRRRVHVPWRDAEEKQFYKVGALCFVDELSRR